MTEGSFSGHLDAICCPECHQPLDDEGKCPACELVAETERLGLYGEEG